MKSHVLSHSLLLFGAVTAVCAGQGGWKNGPTATGQTDPNVTTDCDYWANNIQLGDTCETVAEFFGISEAQFEKWVIPYSLLSIPHFAACSPIYIQNPMLQTSSGCKMVPGFSYCVYGPAGSATSAAPSATYATPAGTITYNGTAAPVQTGLTSNCILYHLVQNGDTCYSIQDQYMDFTLAQFYSWNPAILGCKGLVVGDYVCVQAASSTTPLVSSSAFPTQSGVALNCNKWHYVDDNDTCGSILSEFGITAAQFYSWNPATGSKCNSLWLKTEVCVGVSGSTTSPTTSTAKTTGTETIPVPSPVQSGIASTCIKYYKVQSGDTCDSVEKDRSISATDFLEWNPAVGSDCANLQLNVYVCVGLTGSTTSTLTTTIATPTAIGSVPSPVQSGISSDCTQYYKVQGGDTCDKVETDHNISAADFLKWNPAVGSDCKNLELNVYVCVAV
ncbi:uncharacterized protein N7498_009302 [Penicillium cinerascens]|uniref:LysM domain-containing protein n=1 Tax=Penicillium cinerascens TaxID=70096 RepID=A0A9W9J637_9EURO|nr:uncharacterized protein N7498_009302 [Penicillium cinerascens]KAJ5190317.1 hypothetical protein N7498_009302 [Penicillium cinerascens]